MGAEGKVRWEMPGPGWDFRSGQGGPEWRRILFHVGVVCPNTAEHHQPLPAAHPLHPRGEERVQLPPGTALPSLHLGTNPKTHSRASPPACPSPGHYRAVTTPLPPAPRALILPLPSSSLNYSRVSAMVQKYSQGRNSGTLWGVVTPFPAADPPGPGSSH